MAATTDRSEKQNFLTGTTRSRRRFGAVVIAAFIVTSSPVLYGSVGGSTAQAEDKACVIFFEGNRCSVGFDRSSCCTAPDARMRGCWKNDEARSMKVYGPAGTIVSVFDSPQATTDDDYFVLIKGTDEPVCVGSFEYPHKTLEGSENVWFYSGGNGLDGKVSTFRWTDPRR